MNPQPLRGKYIMAYVSQEDKKKLAPKIKEILKKYGMKGTISVNNHSTLVVNIKEGKLDMMGAAREAMMQSNHYDLQYNPYDVQQMANRLQDEYLQVNTYWIEENYGNGEVGHFLMELKDAMEGPDFFNHDDSMTDYFHRSHYIDINVGKYNTPYVCTGEEKCYKDLIEGLKLQATMMFNKKTA